MPDDDVVLYEKRGPAAWITLNTPANRNALTGELVQHLIEALHTASADDDVRAIVLTGDGPAFCAGADLKNKGDMGNSGEKARNPFIDLLVTMRHGPKPIIGAINGAAFGGGLGLVASCDIAIAVAGAKFSFSEVRIGVIPAMISVVVLPKLGEHHTMRLFLTGERFTSERALEYGLLHQVVDAGDLERAATAEVDAIAKGGPIAIREAKMLVRTIAQLTEDEAFAYAEDVIARLFSSEEAAEGMAAFAAKRPPAWVKE